LSWAEILETVAWTIYVSLPGISRQAFRGFALWIVVLTTAFAFAIILAVWVSSLDFSRIIFAAPNPSIVFNAFAAVRVVREAVSFAAMGFRVAGAQRVVREAVTFAAFFTGVALTVWVGFPSIAWTANHSSAVLIYWVIRARALALGVCSPVLVEKFVAGDVAALLA